MDKFRLGREDEAAKVAREQGKSAAELKKTEAETAKIQAEAAIAGKPKEMTPYERERLALDTRKIEADIKKIESEIGGTPKSRGLDQINLIKGSLARAEKLAKASGRSDIRKGVESWFVGSTNYTNLVAETNTLRTNVLTMMTDPSIKKFFGPQMSNADVQLMTSAGTTLNPELQNSDSLKIELLRLKDLITRAERAVKQGESNGGGDQLGIR